MDEIKRKWLVRDIPNLIGKLPIVYEAYFLYLDDNVDIRVQFKNGKYEFERRVQSSVFSRQNTLIEISQNEFEYLKRISTKSIQRESYTFTVDPELTVKVYYGDYAGLVRAEVEFSSEDEANSYMVPEWFGCEITDTVLGLDRKLVSLTRDEFKKSLAKLNAC